jgi:hypothetical protein
MSPAIHHYQGIFETLVQCITILSVNGTRQGALSSIVYVLMNEMHFSLGNDSQPLGHAARL